tara:strand:+ start:1927 stop:2232 length:306 start_codon:yes stop_codon:yes gene_type:complete
MEIIDWDEKILMKKVKAVVSDSDRIGDVEYAPSGAIAVWLDDYRTYGGKGDSMEIFYGSDNRVEGIPKSEIADVLKKIARWVDSAEPDKLGDGYDWSGEPN